MQQKLLVAAAGILATAAAYLPARALAQDGSEVGITISIDKIRMNANTVKIMAGKASGSHLAIVEDMATVLDDGDRLRVLAIIGKGPAQNIADTLYLKGIDMSITQANVMSYFKKLGRTGSNLENRLVYITTLFSEEVHVIARSGTKDIRRLAGRKVNFGEAASGTSLTARLLFDALNVKVKPVYLAQADAMDKIESGEIAATVLLAGKPAGALLKLRNSGDFDLLPIPFESIFEKEYLPSRLTNKDYPDLIAKDRPVDTIAVPAVLAVYNWKRGSDRHKRVANFVNAFFSNFNKFRERPRHPKWHDVNLYAQLPGWKRFPYAQNWLDEHQPKPKQLSAAPAATGAGPRTFADFIGGKNPAGGAVANAQPGDAALFQEFVKWKQQQARGAASGSTARPPAQKRRPKGSRLW